MGQIKGQDLEYTRRDIKGQNVKGQENLLSGQVLEFVFTLCGVSYYLLG